jgi:hypothetical protein
VKVKFVIAREGGGFKTEIRVGRNGGWTVIDFTFDEAGKRHSSNHRGGAADGYILSLLQQDPDFYELFLRLVNSMERV